MSILMFQKVLLDNRRRNSPFIGSGWLYKQVYGKCSWKLSTDLAKNIWHSAVFHEKKLIIRKFPSTLTTCLIVKK